MRSSTSSRWKSQWRADAFDQLGSVHVIPDRSRPKDGASLARASLAHVPGIHVFGSHDGSRTRRIFRPVATGNWSRSPMAGADFRSFGGDRQRPSGIRHKLGMTQEVLSECHSISIGFDVKPVGRSKFSFPALTHYSELPAARLPYLTLFPIGNADKIAAFYDDPIKRGCDEHSLAKAYELRSFTVDPALNWAARRWIKFGASWHVERYARRRAGLRRACRATGPPQSRPARAGNCFPFLLAARVGAAWRFPGLPLPALQADSDIMGVKHFGARVTRFEDPALLAGRGRFVDDIALPGALNACFVRSPHGHAKFRSIDTSVALAMPGVHAVLTAADLPGPMRTSRIPMILPVADNRTMRTQHCLAHRRGELRWPGYRRGDRRQPAPRRGRRRDGGGRLRGIADRERRARGGRARGAAGAHRHSGQCGAGGAYSIRRRRRCLRPRDACVRGGNLGAPRRRHGNGSPRGAGELRAGHRHADGVVGNPDAAPRSAHSRRSVRARSRVRSA